MGVFDGNYRTISNLRLASDDNASADGGQFVAPDGLVGPDDLTGLADLWLAHRR